MKFINLIISFLFFISSSAFELDGNYKPGELIVQLKSGKTIEVTLENLNRNYPNLNIVVKKVLSNRLNIWLLNFNKGYVTFEVVKRIVNADADVLFAQANHTNISLRNTPNDTHFDKMWGLSNLTNIGSDISAEAAWEISTGGITKKGDTIVVAVIDDGFDLNHEDMDYWKNRAEIPNNNTDDDNNGFVDDYDGWNAFNNNGIIFAEFHGTHVAGTIGAKGNNDTGVVGVNWNVKIMPIMGSDSEESTVIAAYDFALQHRALYNKTGGKQGSYIVATNSSFGVDYGKPAEYPIWCSFYDSLGAYGILSVGATINDNTNVDVDGDIPTACPSDYLVAVTSTNMSDKKDQFAGYGATHIDLGAPGDGIYSTVPNDKYAYESGTSMATPHVAGTIALMYSEICDTVLDSFTNNSAGLALQVKQILLENVDEIGDLNGISLTGGRLNAHKALLSIKEIGGCDSITTPDSNDIEVKTSKFGIYPNPANISVTISYDENQIGATSILFIDAVGRVILQKDEIVEQRKSVKLRTDNLNKGIYFVYLLNDEQEVVPPQKLVIY